MWQWLTLREHITDGRLEAVIVARVNMAPRLARAIASSVVQGPAAFGLAVASYSLAAERCRTVAERCRFAALDFHKNAAVDAGDVQLADCESTCGLQAEQWYTGNIWERQSNALGQNNLPSRPH